MTAVIIDSIINKTINECFGVASCLELTVFGKTLGSLIVSDLSFCNPEKIYVCSDVGGVTENFLSDGTETLDSFKDLIPLCSAKPDDFTCLVFSNVVFQTDFEITQKIKHSFSDINFLTGSKGEKAVAIYSNSQLCSLLSHDDFEPKTLFLQNGKEIKTNGYCAFINSPNDYKNFLLDILSGKTDTKLPETAQGIYAEDVIPEGYFAVVPPVYFGKGVQIERGCVVGPFTAVMENTLIAENTVVKNSIIGEGAYISSGCFLDGVICGENISVRRNCVVFSGSVLAMECSLGEDTVIENDSYIMPFSKIDDFKKNFVNFKAENTCSMSGFCGYTPEKAALLGAAVGIAFGSPKTAIACDGNLNSTALKFALLSGLMTTGAACYDFGNTYLSALHYYMEFCELDCAVFVTGNRGGTSIAVFRKNGYSLSKSDYYNIKNIMTTGNIKRCDCDECKSIRQIRGMQRMYVQNLVKKIEGELNFLPVVCCENTKIMQTVQTALAKICPKESEKKLILKINGDGTKVNAVCGDVCFPHSVISETVNFFKNGGSFADGVFKAGSRLRDVDAVILCFELIEVLQKSNLTLAQAYKKLPVFYVAENSLASKVPLGALASQLSDTRKVTFGDGALRFCDGSARVRINKTDDGVFKIAAKSLSQEVAEEIVGNLTDIISRY